MSIVVTGATGALGRLVIDELLAKVPAEQVVAVVRDRAKAADIAGRGVELRVADYGKPETLDGAFRAGVCARLRHYFPGTSFHLPTHFWKLLRHLRANSPTAGSGR